MAEGDEDVDGLGIVSEDTGELFKKAAEWLRTNTSLKVSTAQKLCAYGLYKQATEGPCNTGKPGIFDMTGRAKWDAWNKLGKMEAEEAMKKYLELVKDLDPEWQTTIPKAVSVGQEKGGGGGGGGPVVSTLMNSAEVIPDESKSVFDWCKEGQVERLSPLLSDTNINSTDDQGMCMLHWACDRGHVEVAKLLVERGADVNQQDRDLQTPLHYAACCDHAEVVRYLLSIPNINKDLCDCDGATPTEVTSNPSLRALFRTA